MAQDALRTLVGLQSPSNYTARFGAADTPRMPSRNNARVDALRRMFGMGADTGDTSQADLESAYQNFQTEQEIDDARKAEAAQALEQTKGQYGLAQEELKGRYGVNEAQVAADRAALEHQTAREFTAGQGALNRNAVTDRMGQTQQNMQARSATNARNQSLVQRMGRLGTGKEDAPRPAGEGFWGWLTGPSQKKLNQAEMAKLQGQFDTGADPASIDQNLISQAVRELMSMPSATIEDLLAAGNDFTPAELDAIRAQTGR